MATVAVTTSPTESSATVSACRTTRSPMRRSKACTSRSPRTSAQMTKNSSTKVVTLMPPAVPAEPPPMNISTTVISSVPSLTAPKSMELKPAVRGITAWKNPASSRPGVSSWPSVAGLRHSLAVMTTVPRSSSTAVAHSVILVCIDHPRGVRS